MRRSAALIVILSAVFFPGCGADSGEGSTPTTAATPADAAIEADAAADRKIALEVQRYFLRNCPLPGAIGKVPESDRDSRFFPRYKRYLEGSEAMCGHTAAIEVEDSRVTIRSDVDAAKAEAAGEAFCLLIQGSDVADFTPGHELQNIRGETIKVCPARTD